MAINKESIADITGALSGVVEQSKGIEVLRSKKVAAGLVGVFVPLYYAYEIFSHSALLALAFVTLAMITIWIYIIVQGRIDVADRDLVSRAAETVTETKK